MSLKSTLSASSSLAWGMAAQISSPVKARMGAEQAHHGVQHDKDRALGAAAGQRIGALAVQTILDDVQIEVGHIHHAEVVDRAVDVVELIVVIAARGTLPPDRCSGSSAH